jgi:hypothetical protein
LETLTKTHNTCWQVLGDPQRWAQPPPIPHQDIPDASSIAGAIRAYAPSLFTADELRFGSVFSARLSRLIKHPTAQEGMVIGRRPDELIVGDVMYTVADKSYSLAYLIAWDVVEGARAGEGQDSIRYIIRPHAPYEQTTSVALFSKYNHRAKTSLCQSVRCCMQSVSHCKSSSFFAVVT